MKLTVPAAGNMINAVEPTLAPAPERAVPTTTVTTRVHVSDGSQFRYSLAVYAAPCPEAPVAGLGDVVHPGTSSIAPGLVVERIA